MKFKVGDRVRVVASEEELKSIGISGPLASIPGDEGEIISIDIEDPWSIEVDHKRITLYYKEEFLELVKDKATPPATGIRTFETKATRDTAQGKLDYVKALSPIVLKRYVQYLDKHRLQPDGSYRDFDNWKNGIPQDVYHSSGGRHFFDTWLLTEGYPAEDNHGPVDIQDAICAQMFNLMGRLHEILKKEMKSCEQ